MSRSPGGAPGLRSEPTPRNLEISIVIPVHDEKESILPLWEEIRSVLESMGRTYELIWVDDASTDGSGEILRRIRLSSRNVRVLRLRSWSGQTAALIAGFEATRGELLVTLDGDGQNDPADIPILLSRIPEYDMAAGYRLRRADSWLRRVSSRIANAVRNAVSGDDVVDTGCTLKAFRRECVDGLPRFDGMHRFLPTLIRMAGFRVCQVPVSHRPRAAGRSKYGIGNRLLPALNDLMAVRWMKRRRIRCIVEEDE